MTDLEPMGAFFDKRADIYDSHMLNDLQLAEFYEAAAGIFPETEGEVSLLDLGCGTGLELERLFLKMPRLCVTGIDLSSEMLRILRTKYPDREIKIICGSYFETDFGENAFDCVLSTYSLHHFTEAEKQTLYKRIHMALKPDGLFVSGDYICKTDEEQQLYLKESRRLKEAHSLPQGMYHYDTPFTAETETALLKRAGFSEVRLVQKWESTGLFTARKENADAADR